MDEKNVRDAYETPELISHGAVQELTQGTAGNVTEGAQQGSFFP